MAGATKDSRINCKNKLKKIPCMYILYIFDRLHNIFNVLLCNITGANTPK